MSREDNAYEGFKDWMRENNEALRSEYEDRWGSVYTEPEFLTWAVHKWGRVDYKMPPKARPYLDEDMKFTDRGER